MASAIARLGELSRGDPVEGIVRAWLSLQRSLVGYAAEIRSKLLREARTIAETVRPEELS
jgi:hypothetical protein